MWGCSVVRGAVVRERDHEVIGGNKDRSNIYAIIFSQEMLQNLLSALADGVRL